jgi:hypothetical protein
MTSDSRERLRQCGFPSPRAFVVFNAQWTEGFYRDNQTGGRGNLETTYQITSLEDFEQFLADFVPVLMAAAPAAWPVTKIALDQIVQLTRAELSLTAKKRPKTIYMIDATDRVAWEEEDRMFGRSVIVQVPKT